MMKKRAVILNSLVAFILVLTTGLSAVNIQAVDNPGHTAPASQPVGMTIHPHAPGVVLVELKAGAAPRESIHGLDGLDRILPEFSARLGAIGVQSIESLVPPARGRGNHGIESFQQQGEALRLRLPENADIQAAVALLKADPAVAYAEPDYLAEFASEPNDPRYGEQWGLAQVNVEAAWAQTTGSSNVVIAVIDSGLDLAHEDLAPNQWVNPGEIAGNGVDDDNNGFIDDVYGWNFVDGTSNVQDYVGHGSQVAGVAVARRDNGLGIAGVCGECRVMPVKVSQISGFANYSDIAAGVYYAVGKGARVINLSLGGYAHSVTLKNAIDYALGENVVVVAGAGNDNKSDPFYPAAYGGVISVAGTDPDDAKTNFSNYGTWVDLTAPGQDILTTTLGSYSTGSGTSYAAPFVSGAAGLLLSLNPDWTPAMVRSQFLHTADDISGQNPGHQGQLGAGRLNVGASMQAPEPILTYEGYAGDGTPDLRPDFGSTVSLTVTVGNDWADATDVSGTLTSSDPHVTVTQNTADFGTILAGESKANTSAFMFDIGTGAGYNHSMPFSLALSANNGAYQTTLSFQIQTRSSVENVTGTVGSDTTWTSDKTYRVTGNIGIVPGFTLTIEPGTTVQFAGNYSLNVGGTLIAQGTVSLPIEFEHETAGETWNRVFFDTSSQDAQVTEAGVYQSGNVLEHVNIRGASSGIACDSATPFLSYVSTDQGGVTCSLGATNLWMVDTYLTGDVSITHEGAEPEEVNGGDSNIMIAKVMESQFSGNLIIYGNGQVSNSSLRSLTISGIGEVSNITARGVVQTGNNSTIEGSVVNGGFINAGEDSTITHNNVDTVAIIIGPDSTGAYEEIHTTGIAVQGSGTVTYNRVVGATKGIVIGGGTLENNLVAYTSSNGLEPGTSAIRHNTLIGIEGHTVYLAQVPAAFEYNNFEFNSGDYDVYVNVLNSVAINISAQNNWWGTTDQDEIKVRVYDYDDHYELARLITTLPLTEPSQTAPGYVRGVTLDPASPVGIQTVGFTVEFSRTMGVDVDPLITFETTKVDTWETRTSMPTARGYLGLAAANNGKIYAVGGWDGQSFLDYMEEYDPLTDTWLTVTPIPTARFGLSVASGSDGRVYAIGGQTPHGITNIVEAYDPVTNNWETREPMPTARESLGVAAASDGRIYAIGGLTPFGMTNIVEAYDPVLDSWMTVAPLPITKAHLGVVAASDGCIYAIGGGSMTASATDVHAYDLVTDSWTIVTPMHNEKISLGVTVGGDGRIYAIGGIGGDLSMEAYDLIANQWTVVSPMPTARESLCFLTSKMRPL
jgi:subtilisin family serine protease